jgi:hypothetical protein
LAKSTRSQLAATEGSSREADRKQGYMAHLRKPRQIRKQRRQYIEKIHVVNPEEIAKGKWNPFSNLTSQLFPNKSVILAR